MKLIFYKLMLRISFGVLWNIWKWPSQYFFSKVFETVEAEKQQ